MTQLNVVQIASIKMKETEAPKGSAPLPRRLLLPSSKALVRLKLGFRYNRLERFALAVI